jgi:putative SOS response-associated peptidase YedK
MRDQAAIERYFNGILRQFEMAGRYNAVPSMDVRVIRLIDSERILTLMYWGLISF